MKQILSSGVDERDQPFVTEDDLYFYIKTKTLFDLAISNNFMRKWMYECIKKFSILSEEGHSFFKTSSTSWQSNKIHSYLKT